VLVERVRAQKDKRIVNARLTEEGRCMLDNAPPLLNEKFIDRFEDLESWEKNQILSTLQRIASMMDAENIDTAPLSEVSSDTF
jgi:DNA-binding MarR family transcriptional regulator